MICARFQPKSIKGMELSAPVVADFIQVLPERTVSVTRDPFDKHDRTLRVVVYEPDHEAKTVLDPEAAVSNRFDVHLEQPCAFQTGDEFGWIEDTDILPILEPVDDKRVLYRGKFVIPVHTGQRRLVVREFETWKYKVGDEVRLRERECFCNTLEL